MSSKTGLTGSLLTTHYRVQSFDGFRLRLCLVCEKVWVFDTVTHFVVI